ncbi:head-tail connector protein [Methylobacterium fujisawaense]|uniref:head-tail connector protein n=1 Tax=Methylobacterium fujisawaense TaxID=107400 RepID=UPI003CEA2459
MPVTVVTPPAPIVTLDDAKAHLRVDHSDEDALIAGLVEVATAWLDGPDGWLGRSLGEQVLEADFPADCDPDDRVYPCPPAIGLLDEMPDPESGTVKVRWRAGYPTVDGRSTVPAPIRHAILLMVGHLYGSRDAVTTTAAQPAQLPLGVEALLAPYRIWG